MEYVVFDQLVQSYDTGGEGVSVGDTKEIRVLGYSDDTVMLDETVDRMTERETDGIHRYSTCKNTHEGQTNQNLHLPRATAAKS